MLARVHSLATLGMNGYPVAVEVDLAPGLPSFHIVGLPDAAIQEARDRVRAAIANSEYEFPMRRITANLAPADVRKEGPAFDLSLAVGILTASKVVPEERAAQYFYLGELALDGSVRRVGGVLSMAIAAAAAGRRGIVVPHENQAEACLISELDVYPVGHLREVVEFLAGETELQPAAAAPRSLAPTAPVEADLAEIKGQEHVKRALEVSAAGGHNLLLLGPPGSGKTMLARRLLGILPPLTIEEAVDVTRIYSVAGLLGLGQALVTSRPFRSPHHTISEIGLVGGGPNIPRPGEISLAHHGVLFLDEMLEFDRSALEVLRQPLEDGQVAISRSLTTVVYPASFTLVGAANPCPCGYFGDRHRECACPPSKLNRYRSRLSGPLMDRIDIQVDVPRLTKDELLGREGAGETSDHVRGRVEQARRLQVARFGRGIFCNAQMSAREIKDHCRLSGDAARFLEAAIDRLRLSGRAYDRVLKVARTIADLDGATDHLEVPHIAEAVQYRSVDRQVI